MITCTNLRKAFNGQEVLKGLSLTIGSQEITVVIGRSGEGKSVFLKHLVGLIKPDSGSIEIDGRDIAKARGSQLRSIKEQFGFVFQGGALFDSLTVFDNVAFPLRHKAKVTPAELKDRVEEMLNQVGLSGYGDRYPSEISGGMAKRVAVARALILRPPIILFDEPLTGLDPVISNTILGPDPPGSRSLPVHRGGGQPRHPPDIRAGRSGGHAPGRTDSLFRDSGQDLRMPGRTGSIFPKRR